MNPLQEIERLKKENKELRKEVEELRKENQQFKEDIHTWDKPYCNCCTY